MRLVQDDPERMEKAPLSGGILKSRVCRGSSYVFLDGCPRELGCSIILRGADRSMLYEIKRIVKFSVLVAYHLRLEVAYYNDRYASIPSQIEETNDDDSDGEEWFDSVINSVGLAETDETTQSSGKKSAQEGRFRAALSTSLDVDFCLPYIDPIKGVVLENARPLPGPPAQAIDYQSISLVSIVIGDKVQKTRPEKQFMRFYGDADTTVGRFLVDRCFRNHKAKDRASYTTGGNMEALVGHSLVYAHRTGRIEIEIILKDGERSSAVALEEDDNLMNPVNLPIYSSSYCNLCESWVTPYEALSDETWKMSLGKFFEINLYNRSAICRTGHCSHCIRDNHVLSFFCDTHEGRFQARVLFQPLHPFTLRVRKQLPFESKIHNGETIRFLKQFSSDRSLILNDFRSILSVLEKEVKESLTPSDEIYVMATADITTIILEVSSVHSEIENVLAATIAELNESSPDTLANPSCSLECRYPTVFCKYLLSKAQDWNRAIDNWHRYLAAHARSNGAHVPPIVSISYSNTNTLSADSEKETRSSSNEPEVNQDTTEHSLAVVEADVVPKKAVEKEEEAKTEASVSTDHSDESVAARGSFLSGLKMAAIKVVEYLLLLLFTILFRLF